MATSKKWKDSITFLVLKWKHNIINILNCFQDCDENQTTNLLPASGPVLLPNVPAPYGVKMPAKPSGKERNQDSFNVVSRLLANVPKPLQSQAEVSNLLFYFKEVSDFATF